MKNIFILIFSLILSSSIYGNDTLISSKPEHFTILNNVTEMTSNGWNKGTGLRGIESNYSDSYIRGLGNRINDSLNLKTYEIISFIYNDKLSFRFNEHHDIMSIQGKQAKRLELCISHKLINTEGKLLYKLDNLYVYEIKQGPVQQLPSNIILEQSK